MSESVISLSDFKADASQWLKQLQESQQAVILTQNGRGKAVVQSYESYQRMQQTLLMLKLLAQGEADLQAGRHKPQDEVFAAVQAKLDAMRG